MKKNRYGVPASAGPANIKLWSPGRAKLIECKEGSPTHRSLEFYWAVIKTVSDHLWPSY
jgi:hypothetical protein